MLKYLEKVFNFILKGLIFMDFSQVKWLAPNTYSKLNENIKPGETFNISAGDYMRIPSGYFHMSNTSIKLKYEGTADMIAKHVKFFDPWLKEKGGKPQSIGQTLKEMRSKNTDLHFLDDVSTGKQSEKTPEYIDFIKKLADYYSKNLTNSDFEEKFIIEIMLNKDVASKMNGAKSELSNNSSSGGEDIRIESRNTILEGVAGSGKTYYQRYLIDPNHELNTKNFSAANTETVVFHPSTSYEDFVSGLRPLKDGGFTGKAGIFVELCNRAAADPKNNYLLFIDEINRANTAKVFGDLLMVIEESKRTPVENLETYKRAVLTHSEAKSLGIISVRLQTAIDALPEDAEPPAKDDEGTLEYLVVPDNLYIVGTMNSTDRSVGTIDLALRRRFTWHTMEPMPKDRLEESLGNRKDELQDIIKWYVDANYVLNDKVGPDARLGHSYFFQDDKSPQKVAHDLLKQLAEIFYIFHLEDLLTEEPFNRPIQELQLDKAGEGLGQKIIVKKVSDNNSGKASGKPELTESDSGKSPENPQES